MSRVLSFLVFALFALMASTPGPAANTPSITVQPVDRIVSAPVPASFSVMADGPSLKYQWQSSSNGTNWASVTNGAGGSTNNYTTAATSQAIQGRKFRVVVSNIYGKVTSASVTLTVDVAPAITTQPLGRIVTAPAPATFSAVTTGHPAPTYRWQVSTNGGTLWEDVSSVTGAATASYTTLATVPADNGKKYRVVATNERGSVTSAAVTLTVHEGPSITTQPIDRTVDAPDKAMFAVTAVGPTLHHQWQISSNGTTWLNASSGTGATTFSYSTAATSLSTNGKKLRVIVSNAWGKVASVPAILTVKVAPVITKQPLGRTVTSPAPATFTVTATGNPTPSCQWQESVDNGLTWSGIVSGSGANATTYTTAPTVPGDHGKRLRVFVTNERGSVTSAPVTLTVHEGPSITTPPADQTVLAPAKGTFSIKAAGPALKYQWQTSTNNITWSTVAGGASAYVTPTATLAMNGKRFRVIVSNAYGKVTSTPATLTVEAAPAITTQPVARTISTPSTATFAVAAIGNPAPSYQWQSSSNSGATWTNVTTGTEGKSSSYTTAPTVPSDNGKVFRVLVTNHHGSATSNAALLKCTLAPNSVYIDPKSLTLEAAFGDVVKPEQLVIATFTSDALVVGWPAGTESPSWLTVTQVGQAGKKLSLNICTTSTWIPSGIYKATLRFVTARKDGTPINYQDLLISYTVRDGLAFFNAPDLYQSGTWSAASQPDNVTARIVTGSQTMGWKIVSDQPWAIPSPATGQGPATVSTAFHAEDLPIGNHTAHLTLSTLDDTVIRTLNVHFSQNAPALIFSKDALSFTPNDGFLPQETLKISLGTGTEFSWSAQGVEGLILSQVNGQKGEDLQVGYDVQAQPLAPGKTVLNLNISVPLPGKTLTRTIPVSMDIGTHRINASKNGVALVSLPGVSHLRTIVKIADNAGVKTGNWSAESNQAWLTVEDILDDAIVIAAAPSGLAEGLHFAELTVSSSGPRLTESEHIRVGLYISNQPPVQGPLITLPGRIGSEPGDQNSRSRLLADPVRPWVWFVDGAKADAYNIYSGVQERQIAFPGWICTLSLSGNGSILYASGAPGSAIYRTNIDTSEPMAPFPTGGTAFYELMMLRPGGHEILLSADSGRCFDATTGTEFSGFWPNGAVVVSADQKYVFSHETRSTPASLYRHRVRYYGSVPNLAMTQTASLWNVPTGNLAVVPDGSRATLFDKVYKVGVTGQLEENGTLVLSDPLYPFPSILDIGSDGRTVLVGAQTADCYDSLLGTLLVTHTLPADARPAKTTFSGDGERVLIYGQPTSGSYTTVIWGYSSH